MTVDFQQMQNDVNATKQPPAKQVGLLKNAGIARQKLTPVAQINRNLNPDSPLCDLLPPDTSRIGGYDPR